MEINQEELPQFIARLTLSQPTYDRAVSVALSFVNGISTLTEINEVELLYKVGKHDKRFRNGAYVSRIRIDNFNPNGTVYIGKEWCKDAIQKGYKGLLYLYKP